MKHDAQAPQDIGPARLSLAAQLLPLDALAADTEPVPEPFTVHVFHDTDIHFTPDDSAAFDTEQVHARDNGRQMLRTVELPAPMENERLIARVRVRPIPKELTEVHDKWDRAGYVSLRRSGMPDVISPAWKPEGHRKTV